MAYLATLAACAALGLISALPFRSLDSSLPLWFTLAPVFWLAAKAKTRWRAAGCAFAFSIVWTSYSFTFLWPCAFEGWFALSIYTSLLYTLAFLCIRALAKRGGAAAVFGSAAVWVLTEIIRSVVPILFFPWLLLGHSLLYCEPLRQCADLLGVYGLSFLIAAFNAWLAFGLTAWLPERYRIENLTRPLTTWRCLSLLIALIIGGYVYGLERVGRIEPRLRAGRTIAVVQGNVITKLGRTIDDLNNQTVRHIQLHHRVIEEIKTSEGEPPALVCWAETMVPGMIHEDAWGAAFKKMVAETGIPALTGSNGGDPENEKRAADDQLTHNASFLFDGAGKEILRYDKRRLVAFGEYIPFSRDYPIVRVLRSVTRDDYVPGIAASPVVEVGGYRIAMNLCIEDAHPAIARESALDGADTLINLTNDGWFYKTYGPRAHLQTAAWRSVETRRPMLRVTNTGITCAMDPLGRIHTIVPPETEATGGVKLLRIDGGGANIVTPYMRLGEFWTFAIFLFVLGASLYLAPKGRNNAAQG